MQVDKPDQLVELLKSFLKNRKLVAATSIIVIFVLLMIFFAPRGQQIGIVQHIEPTPLPVLIPVEYFQGDGVNQPQYLINTVSQLESTISYAWMNDQLYFATNIGIFNAQNENQILDDNISEIVFSEAENLIYKNNSGFVLYNIISQTKTPINFAESGIVEYKLSPNGNKLVVLTSSQLDVYETLTAQPTQVRIPSLNKSKIFWNKNNDRVYLFGNDNGKVVISSYSLITKQFEPLLTLNYPGEIMDISSNGQQFIIKVDQNLEVYNLNRKTNIYTFSIGSDISAKWLTANSILVLEKLAPDSIGRRIDNIWRINLNQQPEILIDSKPVARRFSLSQPLLPQKDFLFIPLVENNGKLWILSLVANKVPVYGIDTPNFPAPWGNKQDSH